MPPFCHDFATGVEHVHLLHFGTYEGILYPYVKHNLRAESRIQNETDFVFYLLLAADEDGEVIRDFAPSAASRYRTGARAIPEDVVALFRKPKARDTVVDYLDDLIVPYVDRGRKQQLIKEFRSIVEQDTTIDQEFKDALFAENAPEQLAAFLADLLIYAVGIDPTERDKEYPVENYNLPISNDWFTGREKELTEIESNFAEGCRVQILYGMGGMGKSQIARKFAYDHYRSYSLIHWINANSIDSIVECYRVFLAEKKIAPADQTADAIIRSYTNYMDSHSDWLLIFDNCDYYTDREYADFTEKLLPKNQAVGNILITTRNKRSIGKAKRIEIETLPEADAVAFLLLRTFSDDKAGAERLAKRLGRFPLALEIAGAYIHATPGCSFLTYLGYLEQETKILDQMAEVTNYSETIRDILLLTLKRIKEDRADDAVSLCTEDVLHLFAYGAPYDIDLRALSFLPLDELGQYARLDETKNICESDLNRDDLARTLVTYGLMAEQPDGFLSMHELQQEVLKNDIFQETDWSHLLFLTLSDYADTKKAVWLHYYQHEAYIAKHWEDLAKRNKVSDSAKAVFALYHRKAQTSLLIERFRERLLGNPEISESEFHERDISIRTAIKEMVEAYADAEAKAASIDDLDDYMDRLLEALGFYKALRLYLPATAVIMYALHALYQGFNRWGEDAVINDSIEYSNNSDLNNGYLGRLIREIKLCLPLAQSAGKPKNEYLDLYLRQLSDLLADFAEKAHWSDAELTEYIGIIDAYVKTDCSAK